MQRGVCMAAIVRPLSQGGTPHLIQAVIIARESKFSGLRARTIGPGAQQFLKGAV